MDYQPISGSSQPSWTGDTYRSNYVENTTNFISISWTNDFGSFTLTGSKAVDLLVVAQGGGAGADVANGYGSGGGGAGGMIKTSIVLTAGTYNVVVGKTLGVGATENSAASGGDGSNSIFGSYISIGGGGGGAGSGASRNGRLGGSGGGGGNTGTYGAGTSGQGYHGMGPTDFYGGGGGGGASAEATKIGGAAGVSCSFSGDNLVYAAGGGGCLWLNDYVTYPSGANGTNLRGNGGNCGQLSRASSPAGGSGGIGIVIVRWEAP